MADFGIRTTYDEVPYPSHPYPNSHPDHLATVASLLGLSPPTTERCRVLELGCASGGNLIPMTLTLPDSQFVGIDLSGQQIVEGQKTVEAIGLTNIELRHMSILDVDDSFGPFDYIVCHGVYSWVPESVQDRILAICARNLVPEGIGYVSYNTYPGWHMRGTIRDMMCHHIGRFAGEPPARQVARARALLEFLARSAPAENSPYGLMLRQHVDLLRQHSDAYLFHEFLEENNQPVYFLQFCERLAAHGLRYLAEAEFHSMVADTSFPPELLQELQALAPNLLQQEQYMDFIRNRMFRQTLIGHGHLHPCYDVKAERLAALRVASPLRPVSPAPDLASDGSEDFTTPDGPTLGTSTPIVKAALVCLGEIWPESAAFNTLLAQARFRIERRPSEDLAADAQALGKGLLTTYASVGRGLVELSLLSPCFTTKVSARPVASPLARLQAASSQRVTNLRHELVELTPFDTHLLPLLDGTHGRPALIEELFALLQQGALNISEDDHPITDPARARDILAQVLDQQLPRLARAALLLA